MTRPAPTPAQVFAAFINGARDLAQLAERFAISPDEARRLLAQHERERAAH